jgi:hypothetical protein
MNELLGAEAAGHGPHPHEAGRRLARKCALPHNQLARYALRGAGRHHNGPQLKVIPFVSNSPTRRTAPALNAIGSYRRACTASIAPTSRPTRSAAVSIRRPRRFRSTSFLENRLECAGAPARDRSRGDASGGSKHARPQQRGHDQWLPARASGELERAALGSGEFGFDEDDTDDQSVVTPRRPPGRRRRRRR